MKFTNCELSGKVLETSAQSGLMIWFSPEQIENMTLKELKSWEGKKFTVTIEVQDDLS